MNIKKVDGIHQIYNTQGIKKVEYTKGNGRKDELQLSEKAFDYQVAVESLKSVPDIRTEKVEKIKESIRTGTYKIDGEKIVEKMFEEANFDEKI